MFYFMISQTQFNAVLQLIYRHCIGQAKHNSPVARILKQIAVDFAECINQPGIAIEINRIMIRPGAIPAQPERAAFCCKVTGFTPFQSFFNRANSVVLSGDLQYQLPQKLQLLANVIRVSCVLLFHCRVHKPYLPSKRRASSRRASFSCPVPASATACLPRRPSLTAYAIATASNTNGPIHSR